MKIQFKHWYDGRVLYEGEHETVKEALEAAVKSDARLVGASLDGASLDGASLDGASLDGARLVGARLDGARLDGARLVGASLDGATYGDGVPMTRTPIQIVGLRWFVLILDRHIKIGCQLHSTADWENFSEEELEDMNEDAPEFAATFRDVLMPIVRAHQSAIPEAPAAEQADQAAESEAKS